MLTSIATAKWNAFLRLVVHAGVFSKLKSKALDHRILLFFSYLSN